MNKIPRIRSARALEPYRLRIVWSDGIEGEVDLRGYLEACGDVFAPVLEDASQWPQMEEDEFGYHVGWGGDMEAPTTVLRRLYLEQIGEAMPPADFLAWRKRLGLTQKQAASVLGVSLRMLVYYEHGDKMIPKTVRLATVGAEQELARTA